MNVLGGVILVINKKILDLEKRLNNSTLDQIDEPFIKEQGIELYLKRDDLLHSVISGNKWRKLKYILNHALSLNTHNIISMGGAFSNHLHALAYVGQALEVNTRGIIRGERPAQLNPTLADLLKWKMSLEFVTRSEYRQLRTYKNGNTIPGYQEGDYWLPEGGAMDMALLGVTELVEEIDINYDVLCVPCGTATTLAGLVLAAPEDKQVMGFAALKGAGFLSGDVRQLLANRPCHNNRWIIMLDYHFGGFARVNSELLAFMNGFEQRHGIQLEPIYTGKMLYGVYDLIRQGYFRPGTKIIAVHTGGLQGRRGFQLTVQNKEIG